MFRKNGNTQSVENRGKILFDHCLEVLMSHLDIPCLLQLLPCYIIYPQEKIEEKAPSPPQPLPISEQVEKVSEELFLILEEECVHYEAEILFNFMAKAPETMLEYANNQIQSYINILTIVYEMNLSYKNKFLSTLKRTLPFLELSSPVLNSIESPAICNLLVAGCFSVSQLEEAYQKNPRILEVLEVKEIQQGLRSKSLNLSMFCGFSKEFIDILVSNNVDALVTFSQAYGSSNPEFLKQGLSAAKNYEAQGNVKGAISRYQYILRLFPGNQDAEAGLQRLSSSAVIPRRF